MRSIPDQEHESQTSTHLINRIGHVIRRLNYFGDRHPANDKSLRDAMPLRKTASVFFHCREGPMKAREIMTPSPKCCSANDSAKEVAQMMRDHDCGAVPIVDENSPSVIGIVTDRDLAIRGLAEGKGADTKVGDLMTHSPCCCSAEDDLRDVEQLMADNQVRRVPIVDASGVCVGIVSQADIARAALDGGRLSEREVAVVVERISEPHRQAFDRRVSGEVEQTF